jgi:hypothetical protein
MVATPAAEKHIVVWRAALSALCTGSRANGGRSSEPWRGPRCPACFDSPGSLWPAGSPISIFDFRNPIGARVGPTLPRGWTRSRNGPLCRRRNPGLQATSVIAPPLRVAGPAKLDVQLPIEHSHGGQEASCKNLGGYAQRNTGWKRLHARGRSFLASEP